MWVVKLPIYEPNNRLDSNTWAIIDEFETQEEAIQFVRQEFSGMKDGTIQLVYEA